MKDINITQIMDSKILIGMAGGTFTLTFWNEVVALAVGVATLTYLSIKIIKLLKNEENA